LKSLGVLAKKIRVVRNKIELEDANDIRRLFRTVFGMREEPRSFTLQTEALCSGRRFPTMISDRLWVLKKIISEIIGGETDYWARPCSGKSKTMMLGRTRSP
jgi:hypothetical protein